MVATAFSNVISLQSGGPGPDAKSSRILIECRDLAARRLREALRDMLQECCDEFGQRADNTTVADERRFLLSLIDDCRLKGGRLEGALATQWTRKFDTAFKQDMSRAKTLDHLQLEDMQIVDYSEMDEELALNALATQLQDKCEEELYALGRRFNYLQGKDGGTTGNPVGPSIFTSALQGALRDVDFDSRRRLELFRNFEGRVLNHVAPIYHALNAQLLKHNVLPNLRRDYSRGTGHTAKSSEKAGGTGDVLATLQRLLGGTQEAPQTATGMLTGGAMGGSGPQLVVPPQVWSSLESIQRGVQGLPDSHSLTPGRGNVLHDFRASEVGQNLGQLDAITVDIVATLFDMIFDDREIADPIKALVGRLQIPVLKVAMLDRSFFSSKAHPARRLLDVISRAALRWGRHVGHDDPIYLKIAELIERIQNEFRQDTALFGALCDDFELFLAAQESVDDGKLTRATLLVVQRELQELADMAVDSELHQWLQQPLPGVIASLLDQEWRGVLKSVHLAEGPTSETWENTLKTASELIDSAKPCPDRKALAKQLPTLLKQLSAGFDRIGVDNERRRTLLDGLFSLHASALRGTEAPPMIETAMPLVNETEEVPTISTQALDDGEVVVESVSLSSPVSSALTVQDVADLQRGDWVEFVQQDDSTIRYRLSWISPQRGIFLFTNPDSPNARAISPEAMSLQLQQGTARIVPTEPIFDRALSRTIEALQAA